MRRMPDGSTALHWAAYHGDARTAAALLAAGAHPNVTMVKGRVLPVPPEGRSLASICVTPDLCK
jgi:hypothetical protein